MRTKEYTGAGRQCFRKAKSVFLKTVNRVRRLLRQQCFLHDNYRHASEKIQQRFDYKARWRRRQRGSQATEYYGISWEEIVGEEAISEHFRRSLQNLKNEIILFGQKASALWEQMLKTLRDLLSRFLDGKDTTHNEDKIDEDEIMLEAREEKELERYLEGLREKFAAPEAFSPSTDCS